MKESGLYRFSRPIVKAFTNFFIRPKYEGLENIPEKGRIVLAGTHTHNLDCFLLMSSTKRSVHFLAKDELWKGPKKIFSNMGLIYHRFIFTSIIYRKNGANKCNR